VLVPVIVAGTMNLSAFARVNPDLPWHQSPSLLWNWLLFRDPFTFGAFWCYFTCATASCKRAPFDLAEAESELVAGFHTEYSGFRWLSLFMAEYGSMVAVSGIASLLFLGGWHTGFLPFDLSHVLGAFLGNVLNVIIFILKCWTLVFVMMWVRWTLPRLRIDQVMMTCLKYLLPMRCVLLLGVSVWHLTLSPMPLVRDNFKWVLFGLTVLGLLAIIKQMVTWATLPPGEGMPGMWSTAGSVGYQGAKRS